MRGGLEGGLGSVRGCVLGRGNGEWRPPSRVLLG